MTVILMDMLNEVLLSVFSEWLEILDIGNLDSAVCNQTQRSSLHDLISSSFYIHNGSSSVDNKFLFSWIALRKMKVKNVHLRHCDKVTTSILSILKTSKNFDELVFNSNMAVLLSMQRMEIQTKSLELTIFDDEKRKNVELSDQDFEHLLSKIKGICKLRMSECSSLTDQAFHSIVQNCPMLTDISVGLVDDEDLLTSYSFYILCNGCKHLTSISIHPVTDKALEYIAQYAPQVTHLKLHYIVGLEDDECRRLIRVAEHGNIEKLDLSSCNVNSLLQTIRLSPRLTYLSAENDTKIGDEMMIVIANTCPLLTYLSTCSYSYNGNDYTDVGVCTLATKCRQLKVLKLYETTLLTDTSILCIAQHCLDLTEIVILHNYLCSNDAMQTLLNSLVHLKLFSFRDNVYLTIDTILVKLTKDVTHLTLNDKKCCAVAVDRNDSTSGQNKEFGCGVDPRYNFCLSSIKLIAQQCATTLQHISLLDFDLLNDNHMSTLFSNCPLINSVFLSELPALTVRTIELMTQYCPQLDSLHMHYTASEFNDDMLIALLTDKPHFKSLQLNSNYPKLTNNTIDFIVAHCLDIKTFEISSNKNITDSSVCNMIKHCTKLRKLSLNQCTNITSEVLTAIAMHSNTLRELFITGCDKIKNHEIVQFLRDYTELTDFFKYTLGK